MGKRNVRRSYWPPEWVRKHPGLLAEAERDVRVKGRVMNAITHDARKRLVAEFAPPALACTIHASSS
jgi:hypothetical protein